MAVSRLQDDLLHEFREEKRMIGGQIGIFEPLAASLRKPAAQRLARAGLIITGEIICWLLALAAVAACVFLHRLSPFYLLFSPRLEKAVSAQDMEMLRWSVYALIGLSALLLLIAARCLALIRRKNAVLHVAGTHIKTLVGQHLQRKAAIDAIEQRHFNELPADAAKEVNMIANPAYDASEGIVQKPLL